MLKQPFWEVICNKHGIDPTGSYTMVTVIFSWKELISTTVKLLNRDFKVEERTKPACLLQERECLIEIKVANISPSAVLVDLEPGTIDSEVWTIHADFQAGQLFVFGEEMEFTEAESNMNDLLLEYPNATAEEVEEEKEPA